MMHNYANLLEVEDPISEEEDETFPDLSILDSATLLVQARTSQMTQPCRMMLQSEFIDCACS